VTGFGLKDVSVRFGSTAALDSITLDVPRGQVTAVVGGDGAGKSTLLRALVGEVVVDAGRVTAPPPDRLGYLPASAGSWLDLSVQENVEFVGGVFGLQGSALAAAADPVLAAAGLDDARDRLSSQLSGGMRRKLGFVLAVLHSPDLLVLDEPSTGVDPVSRIDLWRMVADAAARGAAVVMSTTYLDEAERCAALLVLERGRSLLAGTPAEVRAAMPGTVVDTPAPVRADFAWRRGRRFHEWWPQGSVVPPSSTPVVADLEDVVIAATFAAGPVGA
jgi:ABC-2 type transport system ATP-binding protein